MELIKISKLSLDKENYYDINCYLDLENLSLQFNLSLDEYFNIFKQSFFRQISMINLYLVDKNNINYSCIGCIFSYNKDSSNINLNSTSINFILKNYIGDEKNILTDKIMFETSYPEHYLYNCYINEFIIKYTSKKVIKINKKVDYLNKKFVLIFTIESKVKTRREKLDDLLYAILEIVYLIFGCIPKLEKYKFNIDGEEVTFYQKIVDKYYQNLKSGSNDSALSVIDSNILTADLIKKFIKFRKDTHILYDIFMTSQNGIGYIEMNNSLLVQLIEGTYITLNNDNSKTLREILNYYFLNDSCVKNLLNKKDLRKANDINRTPIFLLKAKEHRHYLSHFNMNENKNIYKFLENNYAEFKLILCLRIIYMKHLNISIDQEKLNKIIESVNKWGERHKIKI